MNLLRSAYTAGALALALQTTQSALAQTGGSGASTAGSTSGSTYVLSPFEVKADEDEGYVATNTLSGTRLNTSLRDTAASINVYTEEFMKDIGAFNLDDVMAYGVNLQFDRDDAGGFGDSPNGNSTVGNMQNYRSRGVNIRLSRNYFTSGSLPRDTFNVDRIEQSRGPNSVLFGIGSAGGVANIATKTGVIGRNFQNLTLSAGSFESWRAALDVNQTLGEKAAVRVNAYEMRSGTYRNDKNSDGHAINLAAKVRVLPKLEIRGEFERGHLNENTPRNDVLLDFVHMWLQAGRPVLGPTASLPTTPDGSIGSRLTTSVNGSSLRYITNAGETGGKLVALTGQIVTNGFNLPMSPQAQAAWGLGDHPLVDKVINTQGPSADRTNDYKTWSAFATSQLAKDIFVEVAYNHEELVRPQNWNAGRSQRFYADANSTLPGTLGANPNAGRFYLETNWGTFDEFGRADRGRLSLSAEHDFGKWGHYRAAVLGEEEQRWRLSRALTEVYTNRPFNTSAENANNQVIRRAYVTTDDWSTYYVTGPAAGLINNVTDPVSGRTLSSELVLSTQPTDVRYLQKSLLAALQASYFKERIVVGAGIRRDTRSDVQRTYGRDAATGKLVLNSADKWTEADVAGRTWTVGVVAHVTKNIDLIYNKADNFDLPQAGQQVMIPGNPTNELQVAPNPAGKGEDYGIAITLLDGKLYARATRYKTSVVDQFSFQGSNEVGPTSRQIMNQLIANGQATQADYAAHASDNTGYLSDQAAQGYEFTATANFTKNWRFQGSFSIADASGSNIRKTDYAYWDAFKAYLAGNFNINAPGTGSATTTIAQEEAETDQVLTESKENDGLGLVGNRRYKGSFFTRYTFSEGFLKRFWIGGGYSYQSKMLTNRDRTQGTSPDDQLVWSAPVGEANAALGYELRLPKINPIRLTLNVRNLFDEVDPIITRYNTGALFIPRRYVDRNPRTWQLTADYSF